MKIKAIKRLMFDAKFYDVHYRDKIVYKNKECVGLTRFSKQVIDIEKDLPIDLGRQTIIHESLHVMIMEMGEFNLALKDRFIDGLSTRLDAFLLFNPEILEMYLAEIKKRNRTGAYKGKLNPNGGSK